MKIGLKEAVVVGAALITWRIGSQINTPSNYQLDATPTPHPIPTLSILPASIIPLGDIGCDQLFKSLWSYLVHNTGTNTYQAYYPSGHSGAHGPVGLPDVILSKKGDTVKQYSTNFEEPETIIDFIDQNCPDYQVDYQADGVRITQTKSPYRPQNQSPSREQTSPELWRNLVTALGILGAGLYGLKRKLITA